MIFNRSISKTILNDLFRFHKIIILTGARQVGKTSLIKSILQKTDKRIQEINADETKYLDLLTSRDSDKLALIASDIDILFIDEAQKVPDLSINLKILYDRFKDLRIIITGSSVIGINDKTKESLAGRYLGYQLYPISISELSEHFNQLELYGKLEEMMTFGMYPELLNLPNMFDKIQYLENLTEAVLLKDLFEFSGIRNSQIKDLLKLLAYQIGSQVSYNELANTLQISKNTVEQYVDLLEKSFIIFRHYPYSRNPRNEINKKNKIYFFDLGIRNAIINNFNPVSLRNDYGNIWENFMIAERKKLLNYTQTKAETYFWRSYSGAEVDYLEIINGQMDVFELSINGKNKKIPDSFSKEYTFNKFKIITLENGVGFGMDIR